MRTKIYLTVEVRDRCGQLRHFQKKEANSLVKGWIDGLAIQLGSQTLTVVDTGGTNRSLAPHALNYVSTGPDANSTYGVVVGSGTSSVTVDDTKLATQIAHGTGAGQLYYKVTTVSSPVEAAGTRSFTVQRTFTNNTASPITINEVALYTGFAGTYLVCFDRTLNTTIVAAGSSVTYTYTFAATV